MSVFRRLLGHKADDADETDSMPGQDQARPEAGPPPEEVTAPASRVAPDAEVAPALLDEDYPADRPTMSDLYARERRAAPRPQGIRVGYASDVGHMRDHNEDTLIVFQGAHLGDDGSDPFGFFVVADGMGGHRAGEVASSLAARLVCRDVLKNVYLPFLLDERPSLDMAPLTEILKESVENANDQVHERVPGGGTTLTCALILGQRAYIAHVGDSRAYLLTNYDMHQVTHDHSYVGRLIELGELSPEEAAVHPQRHVLYRAIGQGDNLDIDTYHQPLPPGSRLLLCSDGLTGVVSEEKIGGIIASAATPQEACERLLDAANAAGGPDNITAVLIEIPDA